MSPIGRNEFSSLSPRRPQNLDLDPGANMRPRVDTVRSPDALRRAESNPHSPRRVEFADNVMFSFSQDDLNKHFQVRKNHFGNLESFIYFLSLHQQRNSVNHQKPILRSTPTFRPPTLIEQFEQQRRQQDKLSQDHKDNTTPLVIEHTNLDQNADSQVI